MVAPVTEFTLREQAPLWLFWPLLAVSFLLFQEIGYRLARRFARPVETGDNSGAGYLLSASLALLGLLVAFTFSMAAQRFDVRRVLVVEEANAVGTTYLRVQLLPEPARTQISRKLLAYIDVRREFFVTGRDGEQQVDARTGALQSQIWTTLRAAVAAQPQATINPALLQTTNEMFDLAATDRAALDARVPLPILRTLVAYSLISALIMGYVLTSRRHFLPSATLFVLLALAMTLILDIDRPRTGTITVSDLPFTRAADGIRAMEAAAHPGP
jgi:hypothetical protein